MAKTGWKIKGQSRDSAPTFLVAIAVELTAACRNRTMVEGAEQFAAAHIRWARRDGQRWHSEGEQSCLSAPEVWNCLDSLTRSGRRLYVVAPNAADALTTCGFWPKVSARELFVWKESGPSKGASTGSKPSTRQRSHPLVMGARSDILGYTSSSGTARWVSLTNWTEAGIAEVAESVGEKITVRYGGVGDWSTPLISAPDTSRVLLRWLQRTITWWLKNKCGAWRDTPGACAWSSWLRRMSGKPVVKHEDVPAQKLENAACHGGRAATWFFGAVGDEATWRRYTAAPFRPAGYQVIREPVVRYDVRSMYPTLLGRERFPVRLWRIDSRPTLDKLKAYLTCYGVIASVRIQTERAEYPKATATGPSFPRGTYDTTLASPDLLPLLRSGEVQHVWSLAVYEMGQPFAAWAAWIHALRAASSGGHDSVGGLLVKSMANALSGRLARRRIGWKDRPNARPRKTWGVWHDLSSDEKSLTTWRSICGMVQEMEKEPYRSGTLAACYAFLTAYGRQFMASAREALPHQSVLWQDTDGIALRASAVPHLVDAGLVGDGKPGLFRATDHFEAGRFLTPKHYWINGRWVLAGVHTGFAVDDGMVASDMQTHNPVRSACDPGAGYITRVIRHIELDQIDPGCRIGQEGWMIPPRNSIPRRDEPSERNVPRLFD